MTADPFHTPPTHFTAAAGNAGGNAADTGGAGGHAAEAGTAGEPALRGAMGGQCRRTEAARDGQRLGAVALSVCAQPAGGWLALHAELYIIPALPQTSHFPPSAGPTNKPNRLAPSLTLGARIIHALCRVASFEPYAEEDMGAVRFPQERCLAIVCLKHMYCRAIGHPDRTDGANVLIGRTGQVGLHCLDATERGRFMHGATSSA